MTSDQLLVPALTLTNAAVNLERQVKAWQGKRPTPAAVESMANSAAVVRRHLEEIEALLGDAQ